MKKIIASALCLLTATAALAGCSGSGKESKSGSTESGDKVINLFTFTNELENMTKKYKELHPDFEYKFNITNIDTTGGGYQTVLDSALAAGGKDAPDIYCAESAFVLKYTQGAASKYAATYEDMGIDVSTKLSEARIAQYTVDIGTRPSDGKVVGLGYQATGGAMIYRTDIAQEVFGTDDPDAISDIVGGGSGNWKKFLDAAKTLKKSGYAIVSGDGDLWHSIENSSSYGWLQDGKLAIAPEREEFLDLSKNLRYSGYTNETEDGTDGWFADMSGTGPKQVFAFFGPAWLINYTLSQHCKDNGGDTSGKWHVCQSPLGFFWGGTWLLTSKFASKADDEKKAAIADFISWVTLDYSKWGLQYLWANGLMNDEGTKDCVASSRVMDMSDGTVAFLGDQDMFKVFLPANANASGARLTEYDETITSAFRDQVRLYATGAKDKKAALADFKASVKSSLNIDS